MSILRAPHPSLVALLAPHRTQQRQTQFFNLWLSDHPVKDKLLWFPNFVLSFRQETQVLQEFKWKRAKGEDGPPTRCIPFASDPPASCLRAELLQNREIIPARPSAATKTYSLAKTLRTPRRQDGKAVNLCDLGVFARDIILWVSMTYVAYLQKSSRENKI
jgi:hypothetical protein